jgi:acetyltransferase EpsM
MKKVIIVGAGGHAAELVDYLVLMNQSSGSATIQEWDVVGLIDDTENNYHAYDYNFPYLGTIKDHEVENDISYIMGIANMKYRRNIIAELIQKEAQFMTLIHPTALISPSAVIGKGCVISHNVSIGPKAILGDFNLINSRCTIGHDSKIGNYNFLSPQVVTGGFSELVDENFLGTNAVVLPAITIGNSNIIAAGMIVDKKLTNNATVFHRFKEKVVVISN